MNCASLSPRTTFPTYIESLRNATNGDFSRVVDCRLQVCGALCGSGNPDFSGIGMAVGDLLESFIAFSILCIFMRLDRRPAQKSKLPRLLPVTASKTFYDNAALFTFAIQLASIVTLTKVDFGISASGMGALTMKIVWLVSTLTLLPLLPLVSRPQLYWQNLRLVSEPHLLLEESATLG